MWTFETLKKLTLIIIIIVIIILVLLLLVTIWRRRKKRCAVRLFWVCKYACREGKTFLRGWGGRGVHLLRRSPVGRGGGGRSASFAEVSSGSTLSFNGTVWSRLGRGNGPFACDALLICNELHEGSIQIGSEKNMPEGDDQIGNEEDV